MAAAPPERSCRQPLCSWRTHGLLLAAAGLAARAPPLPLAVPSKQSRDAPVDRYATLPTFALPPNATLWVTAWVGADGGDIK